VTGPLRELGGARDHVLDVLRGDARAALYRCDDVHLGAERAKELEALLAEAVGHDDERPAALRVADERERRAGAAARVLDDGVAGRKETVPSAPSTIASATRSFIDPNGLRYQSSAPFSGTIVASRTSGVLPIASRIDVIVRAAG
jgi:hypothetical protein